MKWPRQLLSRRRIYGELSKEIEEHLAEKVEELVAGGMSRRDAEAGARREFGSVRLVEQDGRAVSISRLLQGNPIPEGMSYSTVLDLS